MLISEDIQHYQDFRMPELLALADMLGLPANWYEPASASFIHPYLECRFDSGETARRLVERAVMVRSVFEVWGEGATFEELVLSLKQCPAHMTEPFGAQSWCIKTETFGSTTTLEAKRSMFEALGFLPLRGSINLESPECQLGLLINYEKAKRHDEKPTALKFWFGRQIAMSSRPVCEAYSLKRRTWIGPTSTSAELAFLMANQAQVTSKSLVLDPFVGTGSLLVSAAHFGAVCIGCDIDYNTIKGKGLWRNRVFCCVHPHLLLRAFLLGNHSLSGFSYMSMSCLCLPMTGDEKTIYANFRQYSLPRPDILRADQSRHPWRSLNALSSSVPDFKVDCIIGDPPYGSV